jgi:aryl-phospho-beta-D-glucosidase BglC (GH1 family)
MKRSLLFVCGLLMCISCKSADFETANDAVRNMRVGWNLGNTFESNSGDINNMWIEYWSSRTPSDYETAWRQVITKPELIKMMKDAGFNAIRVPVTWYPHMEATFNSVRYISSTQTLTPWDYAKDPIGTKIQEAWMQRVHEVVDYVISQDMYCIINIHHDTGSANTAWLIASEADYARQKDCFEAIWQQIAEEFKDYDEHLLFEGYNEMLDPYRSWNFASMASPSGYDNTVATSAYNAINNYAQSFVNVVRATGGNNTQRNLIVSTYSASCGAGSWNQHLQDPLKYMTRPSDEVENHIIFEVHSYLDIKDLNNAKNDVNQMISALKSYLVAKGAPVIIGEWGTSVENGYALYKQNMLSFARYFVEQTKANGIGTFYWMGLSDGEHRSVPEFNQMDLKDAIIKGYYGEQGYTAIRHSTYQKSDNGTIYKLNGTPTVNPNKGIYIQNGKKFIKK